MSTITLDSIKNACDKLDFGTKQHDPFSFLGLKVHVMPEPEPTPKLQLSEYVTVSDEFREQCNLFYIEMFGYKSAPDYLNNAYLIGNQVIMPNNQFIALSNLA